ncbi:MAG TPA: hypothetical protein VMV49_13605 [Candidatus Deferrimicrobium sp.]|nr:hypothetical protein [Candidatus Deferrimicrobium sp.]
MSLKVDELLSRIEKDRYLISCKCSICNKPFKDLILGSLHISEDHPKRPIKNVIENLSWDLKEDMKNWDILLSLKEKRDQVIAELKDENAINQAQIPEVIDIARKKVSITKLIGEIQAELSTKEIKPHKKEEAEDIEEEIDEEIDENEFAGSDEEENKTNSEIEGEEESNEIIDETEAEDEDETEDEEDEEAESGKSQATGEIEVISNKEEIPNLIRLLENEVDKYLRSIKRVTMASEVIRVRDAKKKRPPMLYKLADQLDYYLGVSKAVQILKEGS